MPGKFHREPAGELRACRFKDFGQSRPNAAFFLSQPYGFSCGVKTTSECHSAMLDPTKLPRNFAVSYGDTKFDFVVTNASTESSLVLNAGRDNGSQHLKYPNALTIDRHAGTFSFSEDIQRDLYALRPLAMKLNALPAKLLSIVWRMTLGLLGSGPKTVLVGGGEFGFAWNLMMLAILIAIIAFAATIGVYVVAPLLVIALICFVLELAYFQPNEARRAKGLMDEIADNVRDLVEETVAY